MIPFHWEMFEGADPRDGYRYDANNNQQIPLTQEELDTPIYPHQDWILVLYADERGFDDEMRASYKRFTNEIDQRYNKDIHTSWSFINFHIDRYGYFNRTATLRDVMEMIAKGPCYGYLHGFRRTDEWVPSNFDRKPVFRANTST
jgi:hypothetical protein